MDILSVCKRGHYRGGTREYCGEKFPSGEGQQLKRETYKDNDSRKQQKKEWSIEIF